MAHNLWNPIILTFSRLWKRWRCSQPTHYVVILSAAAELLPLTHSSVMQHYSVSQVYQTGWWYRNNRNHLSQPNGLFCLKEGLLDYFLMRLCLRAEGAAHAFAVKHIGQCLVLSSHFSWLESNPFIESFKGESLVTGVRTLHVWVTCPLLLHHCKLSVYLKTHQKWCKWPLLIKMSC